MRTHRDRSPATRRLMAVVALSLGLTAGVGAAGSAAATPGTPGSGGSTPRSQGIPRATSLQQQADAARAAYEQARERVALISAQAERLTAGASAAEAVAADLHDQVADDDGGLVHAFGDLVDPGTSDLDRAAEAAEDAADARQLADMAHQALAEAIDAAEKSRVRWETAQDRQESVEARWNAREAADAAIRRSRLAASYAEDDPAQDRRNRQALTSWQDHLRRMGTLGVVPPPATELDDPDRLAAPLQRLRTSRDEAVPGVAQLPVGDAPPLTVLPAETVRAVSDAFHRLGLADVPGAIEPVTYACGGLVANAWGTAGLTLPADASGQWEELRAVPPRSLQVGDLVVLGGRSSGLERTGLYVGARQAIFADALTGTAGVEDLPRTGILGARRPLLSSTTSNPETPLGGTCGAETGHEPPSVDGAGPLMLPVATGTYRLSALFGTAGTLWSSGQHTGQDFAAPAGTPVVAAGSGVVSVEHPDWAGNLVRIDHGGGVETWYAHLDRVDVIPGQTVGPGQQVGAVGSLGNSTGPHLHFEVLLDGSAVDPAEVLDLPERPRSTHPNGEVPAEALCSATSDGLHQLRCDAAVALRLLGVDFETATGAPLCLTDSYRSRAGQDRVFLEKPQLAATPGTSVHGWGLAVDLCGGAETFGTVQNSWLAEHGPAYGWHHPSWAAEGGSRPEPWHFEYSG